MWKLREEIKQSPKELRKVFVETLSGMMDKDEKVVALEADLGGASGFCALKKNHPQQFVDVGIAEANMMGIAAGMSMRGFVPYVHTFSPFASRRVADQVFLAGAYSRNTINIYGSDPGICAATNGGTHTTFEDIAIYRAMAETMVFAPADGVQLEWLIKELKPMTGVHYIRANRKAVADIYEEGSSFQIGKGNIVKEGTTVLLISMGELLADAINAARELEAEGISVEVIDMFSLKPFDAELIQKELPGKSLVVTYENHSVNNGLGSAVAEVMAECGAGIPLRRIGIREQFGQVGSFAYLKEAYGLTVEQVKKEIIAGVGK